ncbi:Krueppel-like factor 16 [Colius striatus]|uniref:Krueppel-like factor 16 n=1 Tax=Colius striatus TaxID=57412 RepID=UPI002B1D14C6|nr:Krueppel-like factor 16 [Colius striatus]
MRAPSPQDGRVYYRMAGRVARVRATVRAAGGALPRHGVPGGGRVLWDAGAKGLRPQSAPGSAPSLCPSGRRTFPSPPPPVTAPGSGSPAGPRSLGQRLRFGPRPTLVPGGRRPLAACELDFPGPAPRPRPRDRAPPRRCPPTPAAPALRRAAPLRAGARVRRAAARGCRRHRTCSAFCVRRRRRKATLGCRSGCSSVNSRPTRQVQAGELERLPAAAVPPLSSVPCPAPAAGSLTASRLAQGLLGRHTCLLCHSTIS